jgi:hypothetical protein
MDRNTTASSVVMAGLVARKSGLPDLRHFYMTDLGRAEVLCIHALLYSQGVDARDIGERSDAVLDGYARA